jgi:hypothetical protein
VGVVFKSTLGYLEALNHTAPILPNLVAPGCEKPGISPHCGLDNKKIQLSKKTGHTFMI